MTLSSPGDLDLEGAVDGSAGSGVLSARAPPTRKMEVSPDTPSVASKTIALDAPVFD